MGQTIPKEKNALKLGILGAARINDMAILKPSSQLASIKVEAIASRDISKAERLCSKWAIPKVFGGEDAYDKLLADKDIEAIYIPLPNSLHCQYVVKALQAGFPKNE